MPSPDGSRHGAGSGIRTRVIPGWKPGAMPLGDTRMMLPVAVRTQQLTLRNLHKNTGVRPSAPRSIGHFALLVPVAMMKLQAHRLALRAPSTSTLCLILRNEVTRRSTALFHHLAVPLPVHPFVVLFVPARLVTSLVLRILVRHRTRIVPRRALDGDRTRDLSLTKGALFRTELQGHWGSSPDSHRASSRYLARCSDRQPGVHLSD